MNIRKRNGRQLRLRRQQGFTLVELILVMVILAIIGAVVLPNLIGQAEGAKAKSATSQISRLSMAVETYYLDTGNTPSRLEHLVNNPGDASGWNGPYVKEQLLKDPWGRPYEYKSPGDHGEFDIVSLGADGRQGGEGNDADITSWE